MDDLHTLRNMILSANALAADNLQKIAESLQK